MSVLVSICFSKSHSTFTDFALYLDNSVLAVDSGERFFELTNAAFLLISAITSHFTPDHIILSQKVDFCLGMSLLLFPCVQVVTFFLAHQSSIIYMFRNGVEKVTLSSLNQLKVITRIFGWLGYQDFVHKQVCLPFPK